MSRKKPKHKNREDFDADLLLEQIIDLVQIGGPHYVESQKVKAPIIKRNQCINFIVMMTIIITIGILAFYRIIDGSAATGLIGAIIGYVFGGLYQSGKR